MVYLHFATTEAGVSTTVAPSATSSWHCGEKQEGAWARNGDGVRVYVRASAWIGGELDMMDLDRTGEAYLGDGPVPDGDAEAVAEEVGRHCLPHDAEPQEPYLHLGFLPVSFVGPRSYPNFRPSLRETRRRKRYTCAAVLVLYRVQSSLFAASQSSNSLQLLLFLYYSHFLSHAAGIFLLGLRGRSLGSPPSTEPSKA
jgi:hypothetical protein